MSLLRDHDEAERGSGDDSTLVVLHPGYHRRSMKQRIESILKEHQHELLDAVNLEESQAARERIAGLIVDEMP